MEQEEGGPLVREVLPVAVREHAGVGGDVEVAGNGGR
jgi:hypothetical protein